MTPDPDGHIDLGEAPARVVLYTKPGCHLCEQARAVIELVCTELGETYDEIDIATSQELTRRHADEIPVTFVDGSQHDVWAVDASRLREALALRPPTTSQADPA